MLGEYYSPKEFRMNAYKGTIIHSGLKFTQMLNGSEVMGLVLKSVG